MTNEELLLKIREDRPNQVIHEVLKFEQTKFGYYNVSVNMEIELMGTKIKNHHITIPYPLKEYQKFIEKFNLK